ncbi:MAG: flagellar FliJ family protein, partial [Phycisphaerales bacterium]|nr:flagellar FliJ family protein [Phycisphaerales bacterium]
QLRGTLDLHALRSRAHRSLHAVREAQQLAIALAGVHHRLDAARRRLAEAVRRRRAIELLRDRALETWRRDEDRRETAELDDLGKASVAFSLEYRADEDQP